MARRYKNKAKSGSAFALNPMQKLAAARYRATMGKNPFMPFLAVPIQNMLARIVDDPAFTSMSISKEMHLTISKTFLEDCTIEEIAWALIHEVSHPLRRHFRRAEKRGVNPQDAAIVNACMDAEINDDFPGDPTKCLPKGFCWLADDLPTQPKLPRGRVWEEYYDALPRNGKGQKYIPGHPVFGQDRKDLPSQGSGGQGGQGGQGQGPKGKGQGPGKNGQRPQNGGQCGSGATGVPGFGEPETKAEAGEGRSQAEINMYRNVVAAAIRDHVAKKGRGSVPAGWLRFSEAQLTPPTIPWQTKLRRWARRGVAAMAGQTDYRYDRPSRRQGGVGYGPGRPVFPRMYSPVPRVAGAFDTSGSMCQAAIKAALSEWAGIMKELSTPMAIYACDAAVHEAKVVRTVADAMAAMKGGGGTDFRPIFRAVMKAGRGRAPDVLVIFTDGDGPAPAINPLPRTKILWVLVDRPHWEACIPYTDEGEPVTYGEVLRIPATKETKAA